MYNYLVNFFQRIIRIPRYFKNIDSDIIVFNADAAKMKFLLTANQLCLQPFISKMLPEFDECFRIAFVAQRDTASAAYYEMNLTGTPAAAFPIP